MESMSKSWQLSTWKQDISKLNVFPGLEDNIAVRTKYSKHITDAQQFCQQLITKMKHSNIWADESLSSLATCEFNNWKI